MLKRSFLSVAAICLAVVMIAVYFPARHAKRYKYISVENAVDEIVLQTPYARPGGSSQQRCSYNDIILNNQVLPNRGNVSAKQIFNPPLPGGEYVPKHCTPLVQTALIVPYRNRTQQLMIFVNYMHKFLQQQNIHYRIIVAEQDNLLPFNRAKMLNFGAKFAMDLGFNCLILHDVDLIPLNTGNLYGCSIKPRHMSSSLDTFRYNLPYLSLFGGAVAILANHFKQVNGMSNSFYGWGGEDDDFYQRLKSHHLMPYRFDPKLSKYTMLAHKKQPKNLERFEKLKKSLENMQDGLNSLSAKYSAVYLEELFTRVVSTA